MAAPRIDVRALAAHLGGRTVLDGLTLTLDRPGLVALAGPNGVGKSTLLRIAAGVLAPTRGTIAIDGADVSALTAQARAERIAYVPQERIVHWPLSARAVVTLGRLPHQRAGRASRDDDDRAVDAALAAMDATAFAERRVTELSGGERARVLMARALAQTPSVLLADEPAAGLDPAHQWSLFAALAARAEAGMRVIVALHDLALAERFAATVVLLDASGAATVGPPAEVLTPARLAAVYGIDVARVDVAGRPVLVQTGIMPARATGMGP